MSANGVNLNVAEEGVMGVAAAPPGPSNATAMPGLQEQRPRSSRMFRFLAFPPTQPTRGILPSLRRCDPPRPRPTLCSLVCDLAGTLSLDSHPFHHPSWSPLSVSSLCASHPRWFHPGLHSGPTQAAVACVQVLFVVRFPSLFISPVFAASLIGGQQRWTGAQDEEGLVSMWVERLVDEAPENRRDHHS